MADGEIKTTPKIRNDSAFKLFLKMRFILFHVIFIGASFWVAPTQKAIIAGIILYFIRMFGVTAGYHRYFSHRAFKTSRFFAFCLAFLAQTSAQRGIIWWASNHRHHHRFSDKPEDLHSPLQSGLFHSHVGWLWNPTSYIQKPNVADLERLPELCWLNNNPMIPAICLGIACWLSMGWAGLVYSFGISTIVLFHATFTINSLSHVWGKKVYPTKDDSRNNFWLALLTLGEGWHNNHHHYMRSARQGFYWWQIDITFYILFCLDKIGLVWNLRPVPSKQKHYVQD
jgi:stearoyl-CoA desaturase (Delta-9 desaturase)